jgi:hypothetical protein
MSTGSAPTTTTQVIDVAGEAIHAMHDDSVAFARIGEQGL